MNGGITILKDHHTGRPTGEAYIQFTDKSGAENALKKRKEKIGDR